MQPPVSITLAEVEKLKVGIAIAGMQPAKAASAQPKRKLKPTRLTGGFSNRFTVLPLTGDLISGVYTS